MFCLPYERLCRRVPCHRGIGSDSEDNVCQTETDHNDGRTSGDALANLGTVVNSWLSDSQHKESHKSNVLTRR